MNQQQKNCPCGSANTFSDCCSPLLQGDKLAETPEALMRSRFSAFYTKRWQYLVDTHHPSSREQNLLEELNKNSGSTIWQSLKVFDSSQKGSIGHVEFVAFFTQESNSSSPQQIHENSEFIFEDGRWFYLKGEFLKPWSPGRNDPCWCGSQKKFKKCHG